MPDPVPATTDLSGEIPSRAMRWCEPLLAANRAGWLLCPPVEFRLLWNGSAILANFPGIAETIKVDRLFLPGFADTWISVAPDMAEFMPMFLETFPERGIVQVWTGLFARTEPGVHSWIRAPVNRPASGVYEVIEGIVETDWWSGPLFANLQFVRSGEPVSFHINQPWFQLIEVPATLSKRKTAKDVEIVAGIGAFPEDFRQDIRRTALRRNTEAPGSYRREALARRRNPSLG